MKSEALSELAKGRTFYLVRHGQPQQHKDKIFLGQTDVPLSETGRKQAEEAKAKLPGNIHRIYSSDLKRARETAQIICSEVTEAKGFREMNLGSWGRQIYRGYQRGISGAVRKKREKPVFIQNRKQSRKLL